MGKSTKRPAKRILTTAVRKEKFIKALEDTYGIVTTAAELAGSSVSAHQKWLKKDKKYAKAVARTQGKAGDFVEGKLYDLIDEGNVAATIFYAKTKLKDRGYSERMEFTGKDGKELKQIAIFTMPALQMPEDIIDIDHEEVNNKLIDGETSKEDN